MNEMKKVLAASLLPLMAYFGCSPPAGDLDDTERVQMPWEPSCGGSCTCPPCPKPGAPPVKCLCDGAQPWLVECPPPKGPGGGPCSVEDPADCVNACGDPESPGYAACRTACTPPPPDAGNGWTKPDAGVGPNNDVSCKDTMCDDGSSAMATEQAVCLCTPRSRYCSAYSDDLTMCVWQCEKISAYCALSMPHPKDPEAGIGLLHSCKSLPGLWSCTFEYDNGDLCGFLYGSGFSVCLYATLGK